MSGAGSPAPQPEASSPVAMVGASIAGLIGIALLLGGLGLVGAHAFVRDDDAYYNSGNERLESDAYAINERRDRPWLSPRGLGP